MTYAANNPFFGKFKTPFETPPFDKIKNEHYEPAFDEGIKQMEKEVQEIANNPQPATFENTVVALERSGKLLETVSSVFFNVLSAEANDEMMEISQRVSPKLSESSNNIYLPGSNRSMIKKSNWAFLPKTLNYWKTFTRRLKRKGQP